MPNLANADTSTKQSDTAAEMEPVWAVVGPTAVGKSAVALELAATLPVEIVNCDSVQCYRGFDIGAAKASPLDQRRVPHHLLDFADPACGERVDAHDYVERAARVIAAVRERGHVPLLCGGSGLYARALRYGVTAIAGDPALRARWAERERHTPGVIFATLQARDEQSAQRIGPDNPARLLRALEMVLLSGSTLADVWAAPVKTRVPTTLVALHASRAWLWPRIEARSRQMLEGGLIDEVQRLLQAGIDTELPPMRAVGYREVRAYLAGELEKEALLPAIAARTWQYARRQRTWLRREHDVRWLDAERLWSLRPEERKEQLLRAFAARGPACEEFRLDGERQETPS